MCCQVAEGFLGKRVRYQKWIGPEGEKKGEFVTKEGMVAAIAFSDHADFYFLIKKDDGKLFTSISHSEIIEVF